MGTHGDWAFNIKVDPSPISLSKFFYGLGDEFRDWKPALMMCAARQAVGISSIIASKASNIIGGVPTWKPLTPKYLKRKIKKGLSRAELFATGKMLGQAQNATSGIISLRKSVLKFGVKAPQARALNFGYADKKIPKRWFIGWTQAMRDITTEIINSHARVLLEKAVSNLRARSNVG